MSSRSTESERWIWRARLGAVCLALSAVAFRQQAGRVVADTKFDLTVSPWSFLGDATHLWDPTSAFGQLQNQAYGYLMPMGPFHGLLLSAGMPAWVVQRLWWSLLLSVAFLGFWRLSGAMKVGAPWARLVASILYALSPRIASELTITSVEVWPMALAPWVLWPLVDPRPKPLWWRVGISALAVALCGGVNAVATGAVLILPAVWFLTRSLSRRTLVTALAWLAGAIVAMAWWLGPLVLLGRFSPPFLDWIESAALTSSTASPFETLRGTSAWLGFLATRLGPEWPGGWSYTTQPALIVATTLVAGLGLVGLACTRSRNRAFLVVSVVVGLALLGLGSDGPWRSPLDATFRDLLDGPLAALRNAHKFDLVVRIPLLLGLVSALTVAENMTAKLPPWRLLYRTVVVALVVGATAPSLASGLARQQSFASIPQYWEDAADWLDGQPTQGTVLVLPAVSFADFAWGSTKDDPLQALMSRPMVARDAVPLGAAGSTRFLDSVVRAIGTGRVGPSLVSTLRSAGISFVVVRNDLRTQVQGDPLIAVHASMSSAGLSPATGFGPMSGNLADDATTTVDYRTQLSRRMVEVYQIPEARAATMQALSSTEVVQGGPEDLDRIDSQSNRSLFLMGSDGDHLSLPDAQRHVLTDGLRRQEVNFGATTHNRSDVLTKDAVPKQSRAAHDYIADAKAPMSTTRWKGVRGVSASSSASDATASLVLGPASRPGAAFDGDARTRWVSGRADRSVGEWLQVDLDPETSLRQIALTFSVDEPVVGRPNSVRVETDAGQRTVPTTGTLGPVIVTLPEGPTTFVRVTLETVDASQASAFAISELDLLGVETTEQLALPPAESPDTIVLGAESGRRSGCLVVTTQTYCSPRVEQPAEVPAVLARNLTLGTGGEYTLRGSVTARSGTATDALLSNSNRLSASSSSRLVPGPLDRPEAAIDGDMGTAWVAGTTDFGPSFTMKLPKAREVLGLQFSVPPTLAASGPKAVELTFSNGSEQSVEVRGDGYVEFKPTRTDSIEMSFGATHPLVDISSQTDSRTFVPVGFAEVQALGAEDLSWSLPRGAATGAECGFGPTLKIGDKEYNTVVTGTIDDVLQDRPLKWSLCGEDTVNIPAGSTDLTVSPSLEFEVSELTLDKTVVPDPSATEGEALMLSRPDPASLRIEVPTRSDARIIAVPQNFNLGWEAQTNGRALTPVRVNGWMQGWILPPGEAVTVMSSFAPHAQFQSTMLGGAVLAACMACLVMWRHRYGRLALQEELHPSVNAARVLAALAATFAWGLPAVVVIAALVLGGKVASIHASRKAVLVAGLLFPTLAAALVAYAPWPGGRANVDSPVVQAFVVIAVLTTTAWVLRGRPDVRGSRTHGAEKPA